ncbi:MAG: HNH endonuclease [Gemmataceae bacterium]|nr:HNH endonuclease [Gemmataceae bacterium]
MDEALEREVWNRAKATCEYCRIPQALYRVPFQVDHIIAQQHGGPTTLENLALACLHCNLHKGPNIASVDPDTRQVVVLFHPRRDRWEDHFEWDGHVLVGRTPTGRATVRCLALNDSVYLSVRAALLLEGVFPP